MGPEQAAVWYRRMSALYALGSWTLLGSLFFLGQKKSTLPGNEVEQKEGSTIELPEPPRGFYVETIVIYKEDFVPITEKIHNYLKSWTGGPGAES
ncbi:small integral membrane protein 26 [Trichechus inunguis]|uniref:Small integral membrane protein 26 n=1 Tax=Trichechus manatus latirostris TaxID=127582 RepID=A0A2Y9R5Y5_TRIMA|nr:small integral membrane protein 26 [Trichechus manatus latirostris]